MKKTWYQRYVELRRKFGLSKIILDREANEPYLERNWIIKIPGVFQLAVHRFWKSDDDGGLHDHPWLFWGSKILKGGYWEHIPDPLDPLKTVKVWRDSTQPMRWNGAKALHRVELDPDTPEVWTLFVMGPKIREWGFVPFGTTKWVQWQEYLQSKTRKKL